MMSRDTDEPDKAATFVPDLMDTAIAEAIDALEKAEMQFNSYAESHMDQGKYEKAATNRKYVMICGAAQNASNSR